MALPPAAGDVVPTVVSRVVVLAATLVADRVAVVGGAVEAGVVVVAAGGVDVAMVLQSGPSEALQAPQLNWHILFALS